MTMGYVEGLRDNQLDEITPLFDAGAGAAELRIYNGTQPATGGAATTLQSENVMNDPAFNAAAGGTVSADTIADDTSAVGSSTGTWFRVVDSNDVVVMDGTAGTAATDLILNTDVFSVGLNVSISSFVITGGNT